MPGFIYGVPKVIVCLNSFVDHYSKSPSGFGSKYPSARLECLPELIAVLENYEKILNSFLNSDSDSDIELGNEMEFDKGIILSLDFQKHGVNISEDEAECLRLVDIPKGWGYALRIGFYGGEELILISPEGEVSLYQGKRK